MVLNGIADARRPLGEVFRFEWLIHSLTSASRGDEAAAGSQDVWEWRSSVLLLLNGLVAVDDDLESRCALRSELQRRGLGAKLQVGGLKLVLGAWLMPRC